MTAIELLNRIYNGDAEFSEDLELVERYARLMIEKDRERVILEIENDNESHDVYQVIRTAPMILD